MKRLLTFLLILMSLLFLVGCKETHRRTTVTIGHSNYGHRRPVYRSSVVVIAHGHLGHICGGHCSYYLPIVRHRPSVIISHKPPVIHHKSSVHRSPVIIHKPTVHSRQGSGHSKLSTRVYKIPPFGPRSYGGRSGFGMSSRSRIGAAPGVGRVSPSRPSGGRLSGGRLSTSRGSGGRGHR